MFKIKNYITFFIALFTLFLVYYFDSFQKVSTNLDAVVASSEKKELLKKFGEFNISKKLFLYVDTLDDNSLKKIKNLEQELIKIPELTLDIHKPNRVLEEYKSEYFLYQDALDIKKLNSLDVDKELKELKSKILNSQFGYFIDKSDPFSIFKKEPTSSNFFVKNAHLAIKDRGYFTIFTISKSIDNLDSYKKLYNEILSITKNDKDVKIFSSIFYFVQNSQIIQDDVNKIIYIATFILILLYIAILRDFKLLFNALLSLTSSILFALLICSFLFEEISIFVLVFGVSISSVAIDYMFHHYVHGDYEKPFKFNKDVFFGMLTTIIAFFILSFVSLSLIKQLAIFTVLSLIFSYVQFAFIYQKIEFTYKNSNIFNIKTLPIVSTKYILAFIVIMFFIAIYNFRFDSNLKNLDVENKNLNATEYFFNSFNDNKITFLIKANSIDTLIQNAKIIKQKVPNSIVPLASLTSMREFEQKQALFKSLNIDKINSQIRSKSKEMSFADGYLDDAYNIYAAKPIYSLEGLKSLGFEALEYDNGYISYISVAKNEQFLLKDFDFVINVSLKSIFENELNSIKNELLFYGLLSISFIILVVLLSYRKNILTYLIFLFFPFVMILSLDLFIELNILHIFILFIILSISIDYGIYISSSKKDNNTNKAIFYSIFTTFAGFGVLIFSDIKALFSIGISATIGVLSILFLLIFLKRPYDEPKGL